MPKRSTKLSLEVQFAIQLCLIEAKKYPTKRKWKEGSPKTFDSALNLGIFDKCTAHMKKRKKIKRKPKKTTEPSGSNSIQTPSKITKKPVYRRVDRVDGWTEFMCLTESKRHSTPTKWLKSNPKSFNAAKELGCYEKCVKQQAESRLLCVTEARKHKSRMEWRNSNEATYRQAKQQGIFDECIAHMALTREECLAEAKKHPTRSAWRLASFSTYNASKSLGIYKVCIAHMVANIKELDCFKAAKKYTRRGDWQINDNSTYLAAKRLGIFDECVEHMMPPGSGWNAEKCKYEASRFSSWHTWQRHSYESFRKAKKLGVYDECLAIIEQNKRNKPKRR